MKFGFFFFGFKIRHFPNSILPLPYLSYTLYTYSSVSVINGMGLIYNFNWQSKSLAILFSYSKYKLINMYRYLIIKEAITSVLIIRICSCRLEVL